MGVDGSNRKKKFDKQRFSSSYHYYKNDTEYLSRMKEKRCVIFDGAIPLEQAISQNKSGTGKEILSHLFDFHIKPYLRYPNKVPVIVFILDLHYRPPIKDIDTSRNYDQNAELFGVINDDIFPKSKDIRNQKIGKHKKEFVKYREQILKIKEKIKNIDSKCILKNKAVSREKLGKDKNVLLFQAQIHKDSIKQLRNDKTKYKVDSWSKGKGNPENRKKVYQYLTRKFFDYLEKNLQPGQVFILDGAIPSKEDREKYENLKGFEYCSMRIRKKFVKINKATGKNTFTLEHVCSPGYQMGEGEQGAIYYVKVMKKFGFNNTLLVSTDTDFFAYLAYNQRFFKGLNVKCRFHHFYKNKMPNDPQKNNSSMYIFDFQNNSKLIKEMYPNVYRPVTTYRMWWGVVMGCDFIKDVHKTIQQFCSFYGKGKGVAETDQFLKFIFDYRLKFKRNNHNNPPPMNRKINSSQKTLDEIYKIKFFDVRKIKSSAHEDNTYYKFEVDVRSMLNTFVFYRKKYGIKLFTREEKLKIVATCLNTNYVSEYFTNQHRIVDPLHRRICMPYDLTDNDGCHVYGYKKNGKNGKVIQSLNVPKQYLSLIY